MTALRIVVLLSSCPLLAPGAGLPTAAVQGVVLAENGQPIAGAYVTALREALPPASQTVKSLPNGQYLLQNLPPGPYALCVQPPAEGLLDPCQWTNSRPTVSLAAGQRLTGADLKLRSASVLSVRLQDAGGQMNQKTSAGRSPGLILGVSGPGNLFYPMRATAKDSSGADYRLTVPRDVTLTFSIQSPNLRLADATGAPLASNAVQETFRHNTGDPNPKSFSFTIAGVLP